MMKDFINKYIDRIVLIFFSLIFITEIFTKISNVYLEGVFYRVSGVIKLVFEIIMVVVLIIKSKTDKVFILGCVLVGGFLISQLNNINSYDNFFNYITRGELYYFNLYIFIFIFIAFIRIVKIKESTINLIVEVFKKILFFNLGLILLGAFFEIELFKTYPKSRFGYNGFFAKNGEVTYLYMLLMVMLYYNKKVKNHKNNLLIIFVGLVSLLIGKKVMVLFILSLLVLHLYLNYRKYLLFLVIPIISLIGFKNQLLNKLFDYNPFWRKVYDDYGLLGMLTSTRSNLFENAIQHINENWSFLNFIFGGIEYNIYKVEFEFVDVFLVFGTVGVLIYIMLLKQYFFVKNNHVKNYLLAIILIASFLSGGLFLSVTCMMFLYIIFLQIGKEREVEKEMVKFN